MRRHRRLPRVRRRIGPGQYDVRARVERFGEPAVLLLLRGRPGHGYGFLRLLEADGIVRSQWDDDAPGPSKRIYELTDEGRALLDEWAGALRDARARIDDFLTSYEERR
jgi:DNA-binding PadR family transcriptional regulator